MRHRCCSLAIAVTAILCVAASPAAGQAPGPRADVREPPRLADGTPDLQGVWDFRTITPLERPRRLGDQETLTVEQASQLEALAAEAGAPELGDVGSYNDFWWDIGTTVVEDRRTSLIVDPPDGRMPTLATGAVRQAGNIIADVPGTRPVRYRSGGIGADGPEDRGLAERCLLGFNSGPPMLPSAYNNNMQLFQNADHVVIFNEMVHDARIVPLGGPSHPSDSIGLWMGDSRGHWDGDTLVVETTNFSDKVPSFGPSPMSALGTGRTARLTERFTRLGPDILLYEFTVDDAATLTQPVTAAIPMRKSPLDIFEYACHEGNYGMTNLLSGARAEEKKTRQ